MYDPTGGRRTSIDNAMRHPNGLTVEVHSPMANVSKYAVDRTEIPADLTPPCPIQIYNVKDYPGCPDDWQTDDPNISSHFMVVEPGRMIWFDLRPALRACSDHYLAAMFAARSNDAFTHLPFEARLQKYNECPFHGTPFNGTNRYCPHPKCKRDWAYRNFLASSSTAERKFYQDGFCDTDFRTKEFIFGDDRNAEDRERDVAAACQGVSTDDLPLSFGLVLFRSKKPKPQPVRSYDGPRGHYDALLGDSSWSQEVMNKGFETTTRAPALMAGAEIKQTLQQDPNPLEFWSDRPETFWLWFGFSDSPSIKAAFSQPKRSGSPLGRFGIRTGKP